MGHKIKVFLDQYSYHLSFKPTNQNAISEMNFATVIAAVLTSRQMSWTAVQLLPQQRWCRKNAPKPIVQVRALECTFTVHCTPNRG